MKVKEMIGALQLHKKNTDSHQLMTVWGEHLDQSTGRISKTTDGTQ